MQFIEAHSILHVGEEWKKTVESNAQDIIATGVKFKDACHVACAIMAGADYLISTDIRMLKYKTDEIKLINPIEFFTNELEEIEQRGGNNAYDDTETDKCE